MPLSHMRNPETIRRAVAAFEELGRDAFPLISTATGKAVDYFLVIDGKRYDSRAIAGGSRLRVPRGRSLRARTSGGDTGRLGSQTR